MLSRAAERIYWAGRYLERAENTARVVQQYSQLLLDLPEETGVDWLELVNIFGARETFVANGGGSSERAVLAFLLADGHSSSALAFSLRMARDNIRNSRDLLPQESWESINELYQFSRRALPAAAEGEDRFEILANCIGRCQQVNGILVGTMSHNAPYHFLVLGERLERADMTSRVIDVAAAYLQKNRKLVLRYGSTLWTNVLKSVSGFQMYRQYCQPEVAGMPVIEFLLNDRAFPRAVRSCLEQAKRRASSLPRGDGLIGVLDEVSAAIPASFPEQPEGAEVSTLMDTLQHRLGKAHALVQSTWFLPVEGA